MLEKKCYTGFKTSFKKVMSSDDEVFSRVLADINLFKV